MGQKVKYLSVIGFLGAAAVGSWDASPAIAGALPPLGYQLMCLKYPERCQGGGSSTLVLSNSAMATLAGVNASVNAAIRPRADPGGTDVWSVDVSVGDCEDYAMTKREHLIAAGLPASALRIAYVKTRSGEDHAVLVIHSSRGDLVLDNLTPLIKPLSQTGLRLISISGANPLRWT